ncbi:unnamed protein product [Lymnaea stagnalis]|uniref:Uncharacterized protein n=1 Tax=Lymnaea stagnalis TaxID=6523 RepID=A0AAV2I664_LYMST
MAHLLPPAGIYPIPKGDQFRFQKVVPGKDEHCGHCEDIPRNIHDYKWTDYFAEDQQYNQGQQPTGHSPYESQDEDFSLPPWNGKSWPVNSKSWPLNRNSWPVNGKSWPVNGNSQQTSGNPSARNCHHYQASSSPYPRPPAPTPFTMMNHGCENCLQEFGGLGPVCDVCAGAGSNSGCCPDQPPRPLRKRGKGWGYCPPVDVDPRSLIRPRNKSLPDSTRPTGAPYFAQESNPSCFPEQFPRPKKSTFSFDDWLRTVDDRLPQKHLQNCCVPSLCTSCAPPYVDCCPDYKDPRAYTLVKQGLAPY